MFDFIMWFGEWEPWWGLLNKLSKVPKYTALILALLSQPWCSLNNKFCTFQFSGKELDKFNEPANLLYKSRLYVLLWDFGGAELSEDWSERAVLFKWNAKQYDYDNAYLSIWCDTTKISRNIRLPYKQGSPLEIVVPVPDQEWECRLYLNYWESKYRYPIASNDWNVH